MKTPARPIRVASHGALLEAWSTRQRSFRKDNVFYHYPHGLIAAGIAVAIITVVQGFGTKLKATFKSASDNLKGKLADEIFHMSAKDRSGTLQVVYVMSVLQPKADIYPHDRHVCS